jgi:hypothetical protein
LSAGGSVTTSVTLDFSSCVATARFKVQIGFGGLDTVTNGVAAGTVAVANQFQ